MSMKIPLALTLSMALLIEFCGGFPRQETRIRGGYASTVAPTARVVPWMLMGGRGGGALRLRGGLDAAQLHEFEAVLDCLQRPDATPQQRHHAQQFALSLHNPVDLSEVSQQGDATARRNAAVAKRLAQLQHVLDHSQSHTAKVVACNSLTSLATNHWDNNTLPHIEMRNYALSFLFAQCSSPTVPAYVSRAMTRLLSRITKLGWLECEAHRSIMTQLERFFDASARHYAMGLTLLHDLVEEMDLPPTTRKGSILRRQYLLNGLHKAFTRAMDTLLQISSMVTQDPEGASALADSALQLAIRCLSFDFIGISGRDDDSEDTTLSVPLAWRKDLNSEKIIDLLWTYYKESAPPQSSRALELLMLYTSVPRSLYESHEKYMEIGRRYLEGVASVFQHETGLAHPDNYHMFCRMLGSIRDLAPLSFGSDHDSWVALATNFTVKALHDVNLPPNSLHYLLNMWGRLAASSERLARGESSLPGGLLARIMSMQSGQLSFETEEGVSEEAKAAAACVNEKVGRVVVAYLEGRLEAISGAHDGLCEDPLDDPEMLQGQLEILPKLCGMHYESIAADLMKIFDSHVDVYGNLLGAHSADTGRLEGQLAWLVRVCAALIGGHYVVEKRIELDGVHMRPKAYLAANMQDGDQLVDADITGRVLQLVLLLQREGERNVRCDSRLELALLSFLDQLKQGLLYVDAAVEGEDSDDKRPQQNLPAFLQSLVGKRPAPSLPPEVYRGIFKRIGLGDHKAVLSMVLSKIVFNLRVWGDDSDVVRQTLVLLATMVQGGVRQPAGQMLLSLDVTQHLLTHHSPAHLPFLTHPGNERFRTMLYLTLSQLVAMDSDDVDASGAYERFLAPLLESLAGLAEADKRGSLRTEEARRVLIGVARDLRGVSAGSASHGLSHLLFDLLHPLHLPIFAKGLDVWHDDPLVTTSILKLWLELADGLRDERSRFSSASPAPLILFKQLCASLQAYGTRLVQTPVQEGIDIYKRKYKGMSVAMSAFAAALNGEWSGLGALSIFGDSCMHDTASMLIHFALGIPWAQLMSFPKVATAYYGLVEALLGQCMEVVAGFDTRVVVEMLGTLQRGLANALQHRILIQCAKAIDYFGTFLFRNKLRQTDLASRMRQHLTQVPTLVSELQTLLIRQILTDEHTDVGIMSHPLLSLILADDACFTLVCQRFVSRQRLDIQQNAAEAFKEILTGVGRNLEVSTRRKFMRNVQAFRARLRPWDELILD